MKAMVISAPGGPEVLELRTLPELEPPAGHIRVRVSFVGVNRADLLQRMGLYPAPPGVPADIPGLEYAGHVDAVGPGSSRFNVGERVMGLVAGGAYAEQLVVHEREAVAVPASMTLEQAGAVPEAFVTAYDALVVRGRLLVGDTALVHAAGSGVGTAGVQIARALGCRVIGTSRTAEKLERCRALGLDEGVVPQGTSFAAQVRSIAARGVVVVLDLVGGPYVAESLAACAPRGRVVLVGLTAGRSAELDLGLVLRNRLELVGTVLRARPLEEKIEAAQLLERRLCPLFEQGRLQPVIDRVFPLEQAGDAHRHVAADVTFGKVLLSVSG
jgi:NADPH:quinone reductase